MSAVPTFERHEAIVSFLLFLSGMRLAPPATHSADRQTPSAYVEAASVMSEPKPAKHWRLTPNTERFSSSRTLRMASKNRTLKCPVNAQKSESCFGFPSSKDRSHADTYATGPPASSMCSRRMKCDRYPVSEIGCGVPSADLISRWAVSSPNQAALSTQRVGYAFLVSKLPWINNLL